MMKVSASHKAIRLSVACTLLLALWACAIPNDIPYPVVEGRISDLAVEGQCDADGRAGGSATIDRTVRSVKVYVCDTVDIHSLKINKIEIKAESKNPDVVYEEEVLLTPDSAKCINYPLFPRKSFLTPPSGSDTRMDCSRRVRMTLTTYQDYLWTLHVEQVVKREVQMENQVGEAVIDAATHNVVVYVAKEQSLKKIKVNKFSLGGEHGSVSPDPTQYDTYSFYEVQRFNVKTGWGEEQTWTVMVCQTDQTVSTTATAFARTTSATISGSKPNDKEVTVEYRRTDASQWTTLPQGNITTTATTYTAELKGLEAATDYVYRATAGDRTTPKAQFTTTQMLQLENGSFDNWSTDPDRPKLYYPWGQGETPFWDTGNQGATTVGESNSIPTTDTSTGHGYAAYLASKWIVIKFAAGNIFTGTYLRTDGTNGILGFGRPFEAFPSHLSFDYKFHSETITKCADENLRYMVGQPDSFQVYIVLWHVEDNEYEEYNGNKFPIVIHTRPSEQRLFDIHDKRIVAYAQLTKGDDVPEWAHHTLTLQYRRTDVRPTHIQVVASSSKYGDYFTGGPGTLLVLDNMQLHYDD